MTTTRCTRPIHLAIALLLTPLLAPAATRYVDTFATGAGTGTSWANAYTNLHTALVDAQGGDDVWVAQGTYSPSPASATTSFILKPDLGLYGGFAGNEISVAQRDARRHPTTLNGDIGTPGNVRDNTRQLVIASGATNAILDGFDIRNANASTNHVLGGGSLSGGGLAIAGVPITVRHCDFIANAAGEGGAVYSLAGSTFQNCTFSSNAATANGGAVLSKFGDAAFDNCLFTDNNGGTGSGGAIAMSEQTLTMRHCTIVSNRASFAGYGIYVYNQATALIRNSIFWNDSHSARDYGGGICVRQFGSDTNLHAKLVDVRDSDIRDGFTPPLYGFSSNVITADPLFVNEPGRNLRLQAASPCLNIGNAAASVSPDLDGVARPVGAGVDLGAYEYTAATPPVPAPVTGASASGNVGRVQLDWTNPASVAFRGVLIVRRLASDPVLGLPGNGGLYAAGDHVGNGLVRFAGPTGAQGAAASFTDTNLPPDTAYAYSVFAYDAQTNYAPAVVVTGTTDPPPPPPGDVQALGGNHQVLLTWVNADGAPGVLIVRQQDAAPATAPTDTQHYTVGNALGDGTVVYIGLGTNPVAGAATGWIDTNVANNATYGYRLYTYDSVPNYSEPAEAFGTTDNLPPVDTLTATATDHTARLSWRNPSNAELDGVVILRASDGPPTDGMGPGETAFVGYELFNAVVVYVGSGSNATPGAMSQWRDDGPLSSTSTYYYAVQAYDHALNYADLTQVQATTLADVSPPAAVTGLTATPTGISQITLAWNNPTTPDFHGVLILRKGSAPPAWSPTPRHIYAVNDTTPAGTVIYAGPAFDATPGATNAFVDAAGIYPGQRYDYAVYAFDLEPLYAPRAVANAQPPPLKIVYINHAAHGLNTGTSWQDAYTNLQTALGAATSNSALWVARGTYKPTQTSNRSAVFILKPGLALYGGFAGTESSPRQRRWDEFQTILSGNIGNQASDLDNSERLVLAPATAIGALLDGFILERAHGPLQPGGAMRVDAPITVQNCLFRDNEADAGGAVFNQHDATYRNCRFDSNHAISNGGAVQSDNANPVFVNCLFANNACEMSGGAMSISQQVVTVQFCTFADNSAPQGGNAVYAASFVTATFDNCILADDGDDGGGLLVERPGEDTEATMVEVRYSVVMGDFLDSDQSRSIMNISADPAFVAPVNGDYHLQPTSAAIDAGEPLPVTTVDLDGLGRPAGSGYDMGAYEFGAVPPFVPTGGMLLQVR